MGSQLGLGWGLELVLGLGWELDLLVGLGWELELLVGLGWKLDLLVRLVWSEGSPRNSWGTYQLYKQYHVNDSGDVVVALFRGVAGHNVGEDEVCAVV